MNLLSSLNLNALILLARAFIPQGEELALSAVRRAVTIPEKDVRALAEKFGRDEADQVTLLKFRDEIADNLAKFVLVLALDLDYDVD